MREDNAFRVAPLDRILLLFGDVNFTRRHATKSFFKKLIQDLSEFLKFGMVDNIGFGVEKFLDSFITISFNYFFPELFGQTLARCFK